MEGISLEQCFARCSHLYLRHNQSLEVVFNAIFPSRGFHMFVEEEHMKQMVEKYPDLDVPSVQSFARELEALGLVLLTERVEQELRARAKVGVFVPLEAKSHDDVFVKVGLKCKTRLTKEVDGQLSFLWDLKFHRKNPRSYDCDAKKGPQYYEFALSRLQLHTISTKSFTELREVDKAVRARYNEPAWKKKKTS